MRKIINVVLIMIIVSTSVYMYWEKSKDTQKQAMVACVDEYKMLSQYFSKNYISDIDEERISDTDEENDSLATDYMGYVKKENINNINDNKTKEDKRDKKVKDEVIKDNKQINKSTNENEKNEKDAISTYILDADNNIAPANKDKIEYLIKSQDSDYLKNNFFMIDSTTSVTKTMMNAKNLLESDVTIEKNPNEPQILIYHTHSTEKYVDSASGVVDDTVVGVGEYLKKLLEQQGYNVIHDTTSYDLIDGQWNRKAYETALIGLQKKLDENPSIKVTIDLHRDAGGEKEVTTIDGKNVAKIMFFNGVSRTKTGNRASLINENLQMNLSFSLQLLINAMAMYDDFAKKTYIKGYRYNLHLRERSMLIEVGNDKNTIEEAKNAMEPFSKILVSTLEGKIDLME